MKRENELGITLIALIITIIIMLILAGVVLSLTIGENGIINIANISKQKQNYADAKESLQLMLLEIKTKVITEEKRQTITTDCDKLEGKQDIKKIEYIRDEMEQNQIIEAENPKYALITYRKYIFKIDNQLNIIDSNDDANDDNEEDNIKLKEYKEQIAQIITELGVKTSYTQNSEEFINNIKILADKNYNEGKESDIVLIKSDLSSRYEQTIDLSNIEGYEKFDAEDFIIVNKNMLWEHTYEAGDVTSITKSYDKQTGALTLGKQKGAVAQNSWTFWNTFDLYAIRRNIQEVTVNNTGNNRKESLQEFKNKLAKIIEEYGIENEEDTPIIDKTAEEISKYIKKIARKKFEEGIATYMVLIQADLSSRDNQTVSTSNVEGYNNLTIDDFLIVNKSMEWVEQNDGVEINEMSKAYNQETGTLELGIQKSYSYIYTMYNTYDVYLLKKEVINLEM